MASLAEAHWSVTRALVAAVASGLDGTRRRSQPGGGRGMDASVRAGRRAAPGGARNPDVSLSSRRGRRSACARAKSADRDLDRAHLAGLAAAAALRAGIETELVLPVREGSIYLPAVGALAVGTGAGRTSAVRVSPSGLSSRRDVRGWQTVRRVTAGGMSVTVEDIDPFRDCQAWAAAGRLPAATWKAWRLALAAAARQLAAELPAYASVIGAGLRSVVPMRPGRGGPSPERDGPAGVRGGGAGSPR